MCAWLLFLVIIIMLGVKGRDTISTDSWCLVCMFVTSYVYQSKKIYASNMSSGNLVVTSSLNVIVKW